MKAATEFVGTFLFLFVIALVAPGSSPLAPLAIGGALACLVYMGGHRSGAHYNPAVSFALLLQRKITLAECAAYVAAQVSGGVLAFLAGGAVVGKTVAIAPGAGHSPLAALAVETVFTFMLATVVLNVAASRKTEGNGFYGLAIGGTVAVAAVAAGPISGGAFNPAVGIASAVQCGNWAFVSIPVVGPLIGAALASGFWAMQERADEAPVLRLVSNDALPLSEDRAA